MKKKLLLGLGGLVVLLGGGVAGGQAWLKSELKKESLVARMERDWNLRAHLDDTTVSLFAMPAEVKLIGLKLAPRDAEVGKPLAERAALSPEAALVTAKEAVLTVQLTDLLRGTLNVEKLEIDGLEVRNVVKDGDGVLYAMFRSLDEQPPAPATTETPAPETVTGAAGNATPGAATEAAEVDPATGKPKKKQPKAPMKASEMKMDLAAKSVGVSNCRYEFTDLTGNTKTTVENVTFKVTDIDVAAGDLANHNQAYFNFAAALRFEKTDQKMVLADCVIEGSGKMEPFDAKTGDLRPDTDAVISIKKGGLLGGIPFEKAMTKKGLDDLKKYGIKLGDIAMGGVLARDVEAKAHALPGGKMIFKGKTIMAFPQYEIEMDENSWISPAQDLHNVKARLIVSPELSARIVEDAKVEFARQQQEAEKEGGLDALKAAAKIIGVDLFVSMFLDEQKRLVLPYQAKGPLSKPKVDLIGMAKEASNEALKSGGILNKVLNGLLSPEDEKKEEGKKDGEKKEEPKPEEPKPQP